MQMKCPSCGNECEVCDEPAIGQSLLCPFCGAKFGYVPKVDGGSVNSVVKEVEASGNNTQNVEMGQNKYKVNYTSFFFKVKAMTIIVMDKTVAWWKNGKGRRDVFFSKVKVFAITAKDKTVAWWKGGKGGRDAFFSKAKAIVMTAKNKTTSLWNSGTKGKLVVCAVALLVICLILLVSQGVYRTEGQKDVNVHGSHVELRDEQNIEKKASEHHNASDKKSAVEQFDLGVCYVKGDGVPRDYAQAAKLFRLSAEQGNDNAQKNLGILYCLGYGVQKNTKEGIQWLKRARDQGNEEARELLDEILK